MSTLIENMYFPPGGYAYRDPQIKLNIPPGSELAMIGLSQVIDAVQTARANNPWSGLDPSRLACEKAVRDYQCARFKNQPQLLQAYCGETAAPISPGSKSVRPGCAGCGSKR